MKKMILNQRATAVERYFAGEDLVSICQRGLKTNLGDRFSVPTAHLRR